jgi:hypothetical protein
MNKRHLILIASLLELEIAISKELEFMWKFDINFFFFGFIILFMIILHYTDDSILLLIKRDEFS